MTYSNNLKAVSILSLLVALLFFSDPLMADMEEVHIQATGPEYLLDQSQLNGLYEENIHSKVSLAQSFTPTLTPLTKIEVKIDKPRKTVDSLTLSVRHSLNGSDLVVCTIPAADIPYFTNWIECDIKDIDVTIGETYFIMLRSGTSSDSPYKWINAYDESDNAYPNGSMYRYYVPTNHWESVETEFDYVDACFRTYSYHSLTDLIAEGFFNWTGVKPAQDNLTGFFTVRNNGTPFSRMDWKILQWPSWGNWTFSKNNGSNLKPEDGYDVVTVFVVAPHSNVPDEYLGRIILVNTHDGNDTAIIQARLVTLKNKETAKEFFRLPLIWYKMIFAYHWLRFIQ